MRFWFVFGAVLVMVSGCTNPQIHSDDTSEVQQTDTDNRLADKDNSELGRVVEREVAKKAEIDSEKSETTYMRADEYKLFDFSDLNFDALKLIYDDEESILIAGVAYNQANVYCLDRDSLDILNTLRLSGEDYGIPKVVDDQIIYCQVDRIEIYDRFTFEKLNTVYLPEALMEEVNKEVVIDGDYAVEYFSGYDVSDDLKTIVYGNEKGLYSYDLLTEKERLLDETTHYNYVSRKSSFNNISFIGNDVIMATIYGYESTIAFYRYDMRTHEGKYFDFDAYIGYDYEYTLGDEFSLVDTQFYEEDWNRQGIVIFNMMDLNYYSVKGTENKNYHNGYLVDNIWFDGKDYSVYAQMKEGDFNINGYKLNDFTITVFNRKKREFEDVEIELKDIFWFDLIGQLSDGSFFFRYDTEFEDKQYVYVPRYW